MLTNHHHEHGHIEVVYTYIYTYDSIATRFSELTIGDLANFPKAVLRFGLVVY